MGPSTRLTASSLIFKANPWNAIAVTKLVTLLISVPLRLVKGAARILRCLKVDTFVLLTRLENNRLRRRQRSLLARLQSEPKEVLLRMM